MKGVLPQHRNDAERIKSILRGIEVNATLKQCENAWIQYSNTMSSDWYPLPDDNEILKQVNNCFV